MSATVVDNRCLPPTFRCWRKRAALPLIEKLKFHLACDDVTLDDTGGSIFSLGLCRDAESKIRISRQVRYYSSIIVSFIRDDVPTGQTDCPQVCLP